MGIIGQKQEPPAKKGPSKKKSILAVNANQTQDLFAVRQLMLFTTPPCHRLISWSDKIFTTIRHLCLSDSLQNNLKNYKWNFWLMWPEYYLSWIQPDFTNITDLTRKYIYPVLTEQQALAILIYSIYIYVYIYIIQYIYYNTIYIYLLQ